MFKNFLPAGLALSLLSLCPPPQANAQASVSFICGSELGMPATVVMSSSKTKPFIRWSSTRFADSGWSAERRCEAVSKRLQESHDKGSLRYLTTGRMNGLPVICSTDRDGGSCIDLIYTLKPGQNPASTLSNLLQVRQGKAGPISESSRRVYFSVDELLKR